MNQYPNDPTTGYNQPYPNPGQMPPPPGYPQQGYQGQPPFTPQPGYPPHGYPPPQQPGYPQQPPVQVIVQQKKSRLVPILAIVVGAVVLCAIIGAVSNAGKSNTGTKVDTTTDTTSNTTSSSSQAPSQPSQQHFKAGDVVTTGDTWEVTVNSATTSQGNGFEVPDAGNTYVVLDITMRNTSAKEQNESSILQWNFKGPDGQKYKQALYSDPNSSSLDGKVEPGGLLKGEISFETPQTVKSFNLAFSPETFGSGQTIWDITVP